MTPIQPIFPPFPVSDTLLDPVFKRLGRNPHRDCIQRKARLILAQSRRMWGVNWSHWDFVEDYSTDTGQRTMFPQLRHTVVDTLVQQIREWEGIQVRKEQIQWLANGQDHVGVGLAEFLPPRRGYIALDRYPPSSLGLRSASFLSPKGYELMALVKAVIGPPPEPLPVSRFPPSDTGALEAPDLDAVRAWAIATWPEYEAAQLAFFEEQARLAQRSRSQPVFLRYPADFETHLTDLARRTGTSLDQARDAVIHWKTTTSLSWPKAFAKAEPFLRYLHTKPSPS